MKIHRIDKYFDLCIYLYIYTKEKYGHVLLIEMLSPVPDTDYLGTLLL
jgi:hypothetical protein